jgi:hypothetical protein
MDLIGGLRRHLRRPGKHMEKAKKSYTLDEVTSMLKLDRTAVLLLLASIRGQEPKDVKKISTRELERMYVIVRSEKGRP